jgi:hypothetical protein
LVPVADCIAVTGAVMGMWCDGKGGGGKRYRVWGAVKEGDFGKEVSRVDETRYEDKAEELLADPLLKPIEVRRMSIDLDFFGLTEEVVRPMN